MRITRFICLPRDPTRPGTRAQAARLHLSESTVRNYISAAIGEIRARNRMEAVRVARDSG